MQFKNQITQLLFPLAFAFVAMMLIRTTLYLAYPSDFADLTPYEVFLSFVMGLRVDMITLFTFSALFILLLLTIRNRLARRVFGMLWAIVLLAIMVISFAGVLYFDFIHRHISNEIFNLGNDWDIIFNIATNSYLPYTLGAALFTFAFLYLMDTIFKEMPQTFIAGKKLAVTLVAALLILFIGIRNSFQGKSFGSSDAYAVSKVSSGNLALNGFFTVYRTAKSKQKHDLLPLDEAVSRVQDLLYTPHAPFTDAKYPLMRSYQAKETPKYNVVIVLLESWGAEHIDGFTKYPELGITPYFKELSSRSLKFTNFYANGFRSIFGITSMFTGITLPSGFEYLGKGLELSNLSYLGQVAKQNGYSTISMQGGNRRSYRIDAVSRLAGFDEYYGAEDMPEVETTDGGRYAHTGTFDYNLFHFYHQKLNTMQEPFLGFAFSSTNHSDFHVPRAEFERYPHGLNDYYGALNAYIYVDNAIERFMKGVEKEPWFDRTIFIFTADHGSGDALNPIGKELRGNPPHLDSIEHYRIPLVIYAPKIFQPKEVSTLGSQNDIFPTIIDMLGFKGDVTTLGNSLFDESFQKRFVYLFAGNLIGLKTQNGYLMYNFKDIVEHKGEDINEMKRLLFAIDTAEAQLLEKNRWAK